MELNEWLVAVAAQIGVGDLILDEDTIQTVLDLARDAAHEVERVAAPLTTFLAGVAVGRGAQLATVAEQATALALSTTPRPPSAAPSPRPPDD